MLGFDGKAAICKMIEIVPSELQLFLVINFVRLLVPSVLNFGLLCPWVLKPR